MNHATSVEMNQHFNGLLKHFCPHIKTSTDRTKKKKITFKSAIMSYSASCITLYWIKLKRDAGLEVQMWIWYFAGSDWKVLHSTSDLCALAVLTCSRRRSFGARKLTPHCLFFFFLFCFDVFCFSCHFLLWADSRANISNHTKENHSQSDTDLFLPFRVYQGFGPCKSPAGADAANNEINGVWAGLH